MKRFANKVLSCILALTIVVSMLPTQALATGVDVDENEDSTILVDSFDAALEVGDESEPTDTLETISPDGAIGGEPDAGTVTLQSTNFEFSSLSGKVVDSNGQEVSGVSVQLYNLDENVVLTPCTTGGGGLWRSAEYDVICGYSYLIRFYKAGYEFSENNISCIAESGGTAVSTVVATALNIGNLVCNEADYTYTITNEKATITKYNGNDTAILLPSTLGGYPVTAISDNAFSKNTKLSTVCFSDSITTIGSSVFQNCTALTNVYLPNTLVTIGSYAFSGCTSLDSFTFPNGLKTIESYAFSGCTGFTEAVLPDSVTSIGYRAFYNNSNLTSFTWSNCPALCQRLAAMRSQVVLHSGIPVCLKG